MKEERALKCKQSEAFILLEKLQKEEEKLKAILEVDESTVLGDIRTEQVKNGNYEVRYNGNLYRMTSFTGIITEIKYYSYFSGNRKRARIVMELRNGKRLSFFAWVDNYIKVNTLIEATGICIKQKGFYDFKCKGGLRRIMAPIEISQLCKGRKFDDLELSIIPWNIISEVKETKPIEEFETKSLKEIFGVN